MNEVTPHLAERLPEMRRWASGFLRTGGDTEELVSSTVEAACAKHGQFDPARGQLGQWLYGIMRNKANQGIGKFRAVGKASSEEYDERLEMPQHWRPAPQELVVLAKEMIGVIQNLHRDERQALLLAAEERELIEISDLMDMTPDTVADILYRARKKLED